MEEATQSARLPRENNEAPEWFKPETSKSDWKLSFQCKFLARPAVTPHGYRVALLDISPLASPSAKMWVWGCIAAEPVEHLRHRQEFKSRRTFLLAQDGEGHTRFYNRVGVIKNQIDVSDSKPKLVVFYGLKDWASWGDVASAMKKHFNLEPPTLDNPVRHSQFDQTHLFWIYHPSCWGRWPNKVNRTTIQDAMTQRGVTPWADQ